MATLSVSREIRIARTVDVVRAHFYDFDHHIAHEVHKGIRFTVLERTSEEQRVRQEVKLFGLIPQVDEMRVARQTDGSLRQETIAGPNRGAVLEVRFRADGDAATVVDATFTAPASGWKRALAPLVRIAIGKITESTLAEDKHDLEVGGYEPRS